MRSIIFILTLISCSNLFAQGFYIDGATVSIAPGTIFSVPDSLVNNGTLINNGQIIISGAWINTETYDAGEGQIEFDSDIDQVINHNAQSIERLVISGGGKKEFLADIFVQSSLTLTNGILVSQNGARIVMDQSVTVTGGNNESHVQGPVERRGAGDWLFPVGNGSVYLPVIVGPVNDAAAFGIITAHEISNEILTIDGTLEEISNLRYFEFASSGNVSESVIMLPSGDENISGDLTVGTASVATGPYSDLGAGAPTLKFYAVAKASGDRSVEVFNAVSAGNDGKNDFMTIRNIEFYPNNKILIVNRWGDRVFEMSGYDNNQNVFKGYSDNGNKLPAGTYYYTLELGDNSEKLTGYLVVK